MTTSQKRGALLLLAILVAFAGWRWRVATLAQQEELQEVEEVVLEKKDKGEAKNRFEKSREPGVPANKSPVGRKKLYIELNTATEQELQSVRGIGPVLSGRIVKYRAIRHGFTSKSQLKEVYGIREEDYAGIAAQVYVDTTSEGFTALQVRDVVKHPLDKPAYENPDEKPNRYSDDVARQETKPIAPVNINQADSATLDEIPGIGPSTASNIVKYRRLIYFFHSPEQLDEVWGIRPENKERMVPFLLFEDEGGDLPHININSDSKDELARHKYLGFKEAGILAAYREQHGEFSSVEDLRQVLGLKAETLERIVPYLRF